MTRVLAVAARELRERWLLFPAGLAIGFVPLALPAFGVQRAMAPGFGMIVAFLLGGAAAVVIGSSMFARDAADGRLGFLFVRPLRWAEIWGGKWLAAFVLVVATGFLAAIPWMAAYPPETHGGSWPRVLVDAQGTVFFLSLVFLAVGLSNFGSTLLRSRSAWLALDLVLLIGALWAARRYVAPLFMLGLLGRGWGEALELAPLPAALLVGSAVQVAFGRTDIRRAHVALSIACWALVGTALLGAAGWLAYVRAAGPADLTQIGQIVPDPGGRWAFVEGQTSRARFFFPGFLLETTGNGRYLSVIDQADLSRPWSLWRVGTFSADGRFVAFSAETEDRRGTQLVLLDLTGSTPRASRVTLESSPPATWSSTVALSPAATSALLVHESGMSLFALPSGQRIATTPLTPGWHVAVARFAGEDAVRAWLIRPVAGIGAAAGGSRQVRIVDLLKGGQPRSAVFELERIPRRAGGREVRLDRDGRRLLTLDAGLHLRDAATGALEKTLAATASEACFLADGRVVALEPHGGSTLLRVFTPDGTAVLTTEIQKPRPSLGPELSAGRIAVSFGLPFSPGGTLIVDATDGNVVRQLDGLRPTGFYSWRGDFGMPPDPRQPFPASFFADGQGRVVRLDGSTGEQRVIAGPGAARGTRLAL